MDWMLRLPSLAQRLRVLVDGHSSVLEIGCGLGHMSLLFDCPVRVGVDIHRPYLENRVLRKNFIPLCLDARRIGEVFLPRTFAVVVLLDSIEHFTKEEGLDLLEAAESIATRRVVVFTPRGFFPQEDLDATGLGGEVHQRHQSGWTEEEFLGRGYQGLVLKEFHGPEDPAFRAAYGESAPRFDALLVWRDAVDGWSADTVLKSEITQG